MREIRNLVCHCTATAKNAPVDAIKGIGGRILGGKALVITE